MSSLDLSQEGPAIQRSVKSVTSSTPSSKSPTYASWVLLFVQAPLRNAFSTGPSKPSVLKVQGTGEGELEELLEDFNDGRVQFALTKVKDPNTQLGKSVFFAWCGEGVPEHVKGNYTGYLNAVAKLFEGYHVQINARTSNDLNVDSIMQKVANASGSKYSAATSNPEAGESTGSRAPAPPSAKPAWKPGQAYTPTRSFGNPAPARGRVGLAGAGAFGKTDSDGWGEDAPAPSRSQLEKVDSAYKPTKVDMKELMKQPTSTTSGGFERPDVVRGAYQPVGKVDIAALRSQGDKKFDPKPEIVKGAYQPIGKVDIAAIRAAAQPPRDDAPPKPAATEEESEVPRSLSDRSSAFQQPSSSGSYSSGRLTSLPKPKPAKSFGSGGFTGTKAPLPGEFGSSPANIAATAPVGTANKDFASQGGKTPAQIWQEKKNRERGLSGAQEPAPTPVQASTTGKSYGSGGDNFSPQRTGASEEDSSQGGGVSALRDRFKNMPVPSAGGPPPPPMGTRPSAQPSYDDEEEEEDIRPPPAARSIPPPPAPAQVERSPSPSPPASPARIAMPVARGANTVSPDIPHPARPRTPSPEPAHTRPVAAALGGAAIGAGIGAGVAAAAAGGNTQLTGRRAKILFDYEKAEENEVALVEGQIVGMIEMVDDDWWQGTTESGETGLFPSNYVEPIMDDEDEEEEAEEARPPPAPRPVPAQPEPEPERAAAATAGQTAKAIYDYEAVEENELSFPEGATVTEIEFPDEDWWFGRYNGAEGLFPSNYVELDQ